MIQENKLNKEEGDKLRKRLGRWNAEMKESDGASSGIGIIWNTRTKNIKTIISNSNQMGSTVSSNKNNLQFILINVYGPV